MAPTRFPVSTLRFHPKFARWQSHRAASRIQAVVRRRQKAKNVTRGIKLSRPVDALVKKSIGASTETHQQGYYFRPYQFTNLIADNPSQRIWQIIPDIARGTERDDRIGTELKIVNLNVKGRIYMPADDNPIVGNDDRAQIYVRLMCLSWKMCQNLTDIEQNWNANTFLDENFFKLGASASAPQGTYQDMMMPINHQTFTTHFDRVYKLDRHLGYFPDATSTSGAATQIPVSREFNFQVKCKNKNLKYMNENATQPMNYSPFLCALFCYGNGAAPSSLSAVPYCTYLSTMRFKA